MAVFTEKFPTWILRISRDCLIETRLAVLLNLPLFLTLFFSLSLHFCNRHSVFLRSSCFSHLLIYSNLIFSYLRLWSNLNGAHTKVLCFYVILETLILSKVFLSYPEWVTICDKRQASNTFFVCLANEKTRLKI